MRSCLPLAALVLCCSAFPQTAISVNQVLQFVRSAIQLKQPDKQVAATLHSMKLKEKLTDSTIEELQGEGAGPKTVAALKEMGAASTTMAPPAPPASAVVKVPIPEPPYAEQQKILNEVREYALNYTQTLPDYICTQVTRRFTDPNGRGNWRSDGTITMKLSYTDRKENYKVLLVNGQMMPDRPLESLGGTISQGEFASMLKYIFEPSSDAEFHWERWGTLRGHRVHVFNYSVDQAHSKWGILDGESKQQVTPAYKGLVYVDRDTKQILKLTLNSTDIPVDFPIQQASDALDYDYTEISGHRFLLPFKSEVNLKRGVWLSRNENEFRFYRKFSAESDIKFDAIEPPPIDESKTKEQPPKP